MSNTSSSVLTTIPTAPTTPAATAPEAPPEAAPKEAPPPTSSSTVSDGASVVAPPEGTAPDEVDQNLELAERLETAARREAKVRKKEVALHQREQSISEKEKKLDTILSKLDEDPIGYLLENGKDPVDVAKRFNRPMTPEEKRIKALEEDKVAREKSAKEAEEKWQAEQKKIRKTQAMREFVKEIAPDECPNLTALHAPHEVPELLEKMVNRVHHFEDGVPVTMLEDFQARYRRSPTRQELRVALEREAEVRVTKLLERKGLAAKPAPVTSTDQQPSSAPKQEPPSANGPSSISNRHGSETSLGKKKPLSLAEKRAKNLKELKESLEAEAPADRD